MKHVDIIIPVYNEESNIGPLVKQVQDVFESLPYSYGFIIVDDGSTDKTLPMLRSLRTADERIKYISFSRNFGHQNALKAGIDYSKGDCAITMDGDFQHPPELIPTLLAHWQQGYEVVYTIRQEQEKNLSFFKKRTSNIFYTLMNRLADLDMEKGSADFRLADKRVVKILQGLEEHELFFRGLIKWLGFKQTGVAYQPHHRKEGQSKYTVKKMVRFAVQGITSFSTKPLYIAAYLGFIFSLISLLYIPYVLISYFFGHIVNGWISVIVTIAFFGGMQLCILGIIGLYLGKVFMQGKKRPLYIINEVS